MKVLFKGKEYSYVEYKHPCSEYGMKKKFVYANGEDVVYDDKIEIFVGILNEDFLSFMESIISDQDFCGQYSSCTPGYSVGNDNDPEVKENEVWLEFLGTHNFVTKKYFYELCLFLCDSKLSTVATDNTELRDNIVAFKVALQEKLDSVPCSSSSTDKPMKMLLKGKEYSYVEYEYPDPCFGMQTKFVYANGKEIEYGDKADMFWDVVVQRFVPFMEAVIAGNSFKKKFYSFTFGYKPANKHAPEIKENEVCLEFHSITNIITKKYFYELCLFLCDSKLTTVATEDTELKEKIAMFKVALQEKIASD